MIQHILSQFKTVAPKGQVEICLWGTRPFASSDAREDIGGDTK